MALPDLFLISSPVIRGRTKEGESPKGDLPISDLKSAAPRLSLAPSSILPRMTGEEA